VDMCIAGGYHVDKKRAYGTSTIGRCYLTLLILDRFNVYLACKVHGAVLPAPCITTIIRASLIRRNTILLSRAYHVHISASIGLMKARILDTHLQVLHMLP